MSQSPSPSSAELIAGNDDLLIEILTHLPLKPLLRFKTISHQFNSLISHPSFSLLHTRRHTRHPSSSLFLLTRHHHHSLSSPSFIFLPLFSSLSPPPFFSLLSQIHILQSSNGLLLCSNSTIVNPTTNQSFSLSSPPRGSISGLSLAFDVSRSDYFHVICVYEAPLNEDAKNEYAIDVYSSKDRQWRKVIDQFNAPFDVEFERGVYWEGRVHWLSHTDSTVFFDLEREIVDLLRLPNAIEGAYIERFRYFGESCGHLHLIEIRTNCVSEFDVLELDRREKNEWFVKYRVNLDVLGLGFEAEMFQDHGDRFNRRFRFYAFSVLAVVRANEDDDDDDDSENGDRESVLVVSVPGKVIAYSFKSKVSRLISNVVDDSDKWLPFKGYNAYQFIESLYCL